MVAVTILDGTVRRIRIMLGRWGVPSPTFNPSLPEQTCPPLQPICYLADV
ncbi:MAG: hypothetical protein WBG53_11435 [Rhodococcus sp. (in: high G+C Gram-positive bacteria)]|nr:hypothetical protein [Rhodococcus sp. SBT000017]